MIRSDLDGPLGIELGKACQRPGVGMPTRTTSPICPAGRGGGVSLLPIKVRSVLLNYS